MRTLIYDADNRLQSVIHTSSGYKLGTYVYDGDGNRVKVTEDVEAVHYIGNHVGWREGQVVKYYYAGSQRLAMREGTSAPRYFLTDHLGSTTLELSDTGTALGERRYKPWGNQRYSSGTMETQRRYTGQIDDETGYYFYNARSYGPSFARFLQPDTIVPDPGNPQSLNRYSYVYNNPLRYTDPTGHEPACAALDDACWDERYNRAHGYSRRSDGSWYYTGDFFFADAEIAMEVLPKMGINLTTVGSGKWTDAEIIEVAIGVSDIADAFDLELTDLKTLFGGRTTIERGSGCGTRPCALPRGMPGGWDGHTIRIPAGRSIERELIVHELGHIVDWNHGEGMSSYIRDLRGEPITRYVKKCEFPCHKTWENAAEAFTVAVYGHGHQGGQPDLWWQNNTDWQDGLYDTIWGFAGK